MFEISWFQNCWEKKHLLARDFVAMEDNTAVVPITNQVDKVMVRYI